MIIVGAKGLAKEILEIIYSELNYPEEELLFFDNISTDLPKKLFGKFGVIRSFDAVKDVFNNSNNKDFVLGLGNPVLRKNFFDKFMALGGDPQTLISKYARIGSFSNFIGRGSVIMQGSVLTNNIKIGEGCLINPNCTVSHDSSLGDFVELSPNVSVTGHCTIGDFTTIGAGAVIIPKIRIGHNVVIGAGTVVIRDIPNYSVVVGVPGRIIKTNS